MVSRGAYRFDDPAGEVGIETMLVAAADGPVHQVPLTYRAAPLDDVDEWLVGTTEHSALGRRWVYDGCADPVYAAAVQPAVGRRR
ncbi:maltokinase N-terminal cap-like domain-containing protein [Micromonospora sp. DT4]|uniref:maltokinase N-terminal cap-like domain-containing protein n=1 Tax=Micromonospora sp. DT4 TaxID=3393438 RepID=UPI003CEA21D6